MRKNILLYVIIAIAIIVGISMYSNSAKKRRIRENYENSIRMEERYSQMTTDPEEAERYHNMAEQHKKDVEKLK